MVYYDGLFSAINAWMGEKNGCKQVKFMTKNQNNNEFKFERTMKCKIRKN